MQLSSATPLFQESTTANGGRDGDDGGIILGWIMGIDECDCDDVGDGGGVVQRRFVFVQS